jgi:hypothetical protein
MKYYLLANGFTQTHEERFTRGNLVVCSVMKRQRAGSTKTTKVWAISVDGREMYVGTIANIRRVLRNQFGFNN